MRVSTLVIIFSLAVLNSAEGVVAPESVRGHVPIIATQSPNTPPRVDLATVISVWSDNFDSYPAGGGIHGLGGWAGWDANPAVDAVISNEEAHSSPNSVRILSTSDIVHEFAGITAGDWVVSGWCFVPSSATGQQYFILLNTYNVGGPYNWSTQVLFDSDIDAVRDFDGTGVLPLIHDQWIELRVEIDLDADVQTAYYNNQVLFTDSWTNHVGEPGPGVASIAALDLYSGGGSPIYWDDCDLSETPTTGQTARIRLTGLDASLTSIALPGGIVTGPITATWDAAAQPPDGRMVCDERRGLIYWPAVFDAPAFPAPMPVTMVGPYRLYENDDTTFYSLDMGYVEMPAMFGGRIVISNSNTNIKSASLANLCVAGGDVNGHFEDHPPDVFANEIAPWLRGAMNVAMQALRSLDGNVPVIPPAVLDEIAQIYLQDPTVEVVVYFLDHNEYRSSQLTGTDAFHIEPVSTTPVRLTALDAIVSSIELPDGRSTGPIAATWGGGGVTSAGRMDCDQRRGLLYWPLMFDAPVFPAPLPVTMVGPFHLMTNEDDAFFSVDMGYVELPAEFGGRIHIENVNKNKKAVALTDLCQHGGQTTGFFEDLTSNEFLLEVQPGLRAAMSAAMQELINYDPSVPPLPPGVLETMAQMYEADPTTEIIVYFADHGLYQSANLEGTDAFAFGALTAAPDDQLMGLTVSARSKPNPFNPQTTIEFTVAASSPVLLRIFDVRGRLLTTLVDESLATGPHEIDWNGRDSAGQDVASGVYLARLENGNQVAQTKLVLLR